MPNTKISALTSATTPLAGTETLPIVQSSTTKQVSVANLTAGRDVSMLTATATSTASVGTTISQKALTVSYDQRFYNTSADGVANTVIGDISSQVRNYSRPGVLAASFASIQFVTDPTTWYIGELRFATNGSDGTATAPTTRMTIKSGGDIIVNTGNLVQGTANKGFNFTANTPASGNTSQLLNEYQEGTWTPSFVNGTFGYSFRSGFYTKVGRLVTISGLIVWSSKSGAGDLSISIPFTVNSSNYYRGGISLGNCNGLILLAGYAIVGTLDQSSTSIDFYFNVSAAAAQRMTIASMNSSGAVQFTATYMV